MTSRLLPLVAGAMVCGALVTRPAVVFGDEPTGNLDSVSSREVLALMRRASSPGPRGLMSAFENFTMSVFKR